ncbi:MAG: hybrid sensor histidine kinase/response regulator [Candidatus Cloacimonetes bacterium]|nr:hybrid sensor histidine kinase/response regulator [Candidatus Cloacimonadota bacterium]
MKTKIFYIDDERVNTLLFSKKFANTFDVSVFNNYQDFCEALTYSTPDVFVLDLMMPDVSGFELTSYLRNTYRFRFVPILILTAMEKGENLEKCFLNGADDFMRKPPNYQELQARLESLAVRGKVREEHVKSRKIDSMQLMINGFNHEFNNHLTILHSGVEVLELGLTEEKHLKKTKMLLKTITRASHLLKDISKLYNSERKIISSQGICEIMDAFVSNITSDLEFGDVHFECDVKSENHKIEMSGSNLQVVLKALVSNAIDSYYNIGDDRKKLVRIEVDSTDTLIRIKTIDRGRGIPQRDLAKIFDPFFTTKGALGGEMIGDRRSGTGLGLSLAEVLCSNVGGVINVVSTVGKGTDVNLALPIAGDGFRFEDARGDFKLLKNNRDNLRLKIFDSREDAGLALKYYLNLQNYISSSYSTLEDHQERLSNDDYEAVVMYNNFEWDQTKACLDFLRETKGRDFPVFILGTEEELGTELEYFVQNNIGVLIFDDNYMRVSEALSSIAIYYDI